MELQTITMQAKQAVKEILEAARLEKGDLFVVGCSSSEVAGETIGTHSSLDIAQAIVDGIYPILQEEEIELAAQCCEHLNRALILEKDAAKKRGYEIVNVVPQPKAGGSFATSVYARMHRPVAVEKIQAKAGLDIGGTLIGMHLAPVAVPLRLSVRQIGEASILCARTRPKFIGGARAVYLD